MELKKTATIRDYDIVSNKNKFIKIKERDTEIEFSEFIIDEGLKGVRTEDGTEYYFSNRNFTDNKLIEIKIKQCQQEDH